MARSTRKVTACAVAVLLACGLSSSGFVPGPLRRTAAPVAAASAAGMMMAPAAFADEIGDAAKKLGDASYDFAKEVDWNNGIFLQAPGKFQPLQALKAIDKMIDMGAAADPKLLKAAAEAHHKAIGSISGPNGVTSRADWDAVNAALGRVVASVPKAKVMDVYNAVKDITDPAVPPYMKSLVNGADAEKAYKGFLEFKDVVEKSIGVDSDLFSTFFAFPRRSAVSVPLLFLASSQRSSLTNLRNQVAAVGAPATVPTGDKIGAAAKALSDASYPFLKEVQGCKEEKLGSMALASLMIKKHEKLHVVPTPPRICNRGFPLTEHACLFVCVPSGGLAVRCLPEAAPRHHSPEGDDRH